MKSEEKELTIEQEVVRDCPILFRMYGRPCTETCMSFGFECGKGWHDIIASACRELEMYNAIYYPKYRVRIQANQIKEKFGTLSFYWSIEIDSTKLMTWLGHKFEAVYDWFNCYKRFDYKLKKVVDVESYDYDETKEITKDKFIEKTDPNYKGIKCSNVEYQTKDGKYFEIYHLHNYGKLHQEPTRLKLLWHIKNVCYSVRNWFLYSAPKNDNAAVRNCIEYLHRKTAEIVRKTEQECEDHCEICGRQIGTEWSPVCRTIGWISYICTDCAEKQTSKYVKNSELWQGKTRIKNEEDFKKEYIRQ